MYTICEIDINSLPSEYFSMPGKSLYTTPQWISFVEEDSSAKPLILKICEDDKLIGFFTALQVKKYGVKIIGSPFSGWSTCWMGFDVVDGIDRLDLIPSVADYLLKKKKAHFIQITDRLIRIEDALARGYRANVSDTLEMPINLTDEELFKMFKTDCRNFIRQFERRGASIEIAKPNKEFAQEFYEQLKDVFAKQGMVPTFGLNKVICLLSHLTDQETVLCLRVRDPEGNSIATSIFLGYNKKMFFWGGASYRSGQHYRPNEYMIWTAIKFWREKGFDTFDMIGVRDYKRKFGSHEVQYANIQIAKYPLLQSLKDLAQKIYFMGLHIKGKLHKVK